MLSGLGALCVALGPVHAMTIRQTRTSSYYLLLEGTAEVVVSGGIVGMSPGAVWACPAGVAHRIRGEGRMLRLLLDAGCEQVLRAQDIEKALSACARDRSSDRRRAARLLLALDPLRGAAAGRLRRAVRVLRRRPDEVEVLAEAARASGWSPSRLRHLTRLHTGVSLKRLRLWAKLDRAIRLAKAGARLTDAALDAGFSSSAHLSAAHAALVGLSPRDLVAMRNHPARSELRAAALTDAGPAEDDRLAA
ncbi:helix-turn-helix domain-containing protein [Brevundimonas diminuta]|nr:helix-turn-helix domain-containing protein [Brevundimonas diminuta]